MSNGTAVAEKQKVKTEEVGVQSAPPNRFIVSEPDVMDVVNLSDIKIKSDKLVNVDRKFCEHFLDETEHPRFEGERPYRGSWAQSLMRAILRKTYLVEHVILMSAEVDGVEYRINGQHTCGAIISLAETHPGVSFQMRFIRYKCKNMSQMKALYASVDNGAARTTSHKIVAQLAGEPGFAGISHEVLRKLGEGMRFFAGETKHQRKALDPQVTATLMMTRYKPHCLLAAKLLNGAPYEKTKHISRSPVVAAIIAAADVAKGPADAFFRGVRDGQNLAPNDPMLRARDYLMTTAIRDIGGPSTKRSASAEHVFRTMAHCWNAYRSGETLKSLHTVTNTKARPVFR